MKKAIAATNKDFESSCSKTPEYLSWHRLFKREFTQFLTAKGASNIAIGKPNHFDMSGFFTLGNTVWYFSIGDLRHGGTASPMLIRTAAHYKDYSGGMNQYIPMRNETAFTDGFDSVIARNEQGMLRPIHHAINTSPIINASVNAAPELKFS